MDSSQDANNVIALDDFLNGVTVRILKPVCLGAAAMYVLSAAIALMFIGEYPAVIWAAIGHVLFVALFSTLYWLARNDRISADRVNPIGFVVIFLAGINGLLPYVLLDAPSALIYMPLLPISYAAFTLSWLWFGLGMLALILSTVAAIVWSTGVFHPTLWPIFGSLTVVSTIIFIVRRWGFIAAHDALRSVQEEARNRRKAEELLAQSRRLDSLGRLASGVAHDFNNLMLVVLSYAESQLQSARNEDARFELGEILKAGESASALAQKMLAFGRKQVLQPKIMPLNSAVSNAESLIRKALPARVRLRIELHPDAGAVDIDPVQLQQVLLNLCLNARDAMEKDGGTLLIVTRPLPGFAVLEVTDTGEGIPPDIADHVFEPFFSTKETDRGTGLGLASVHGTITQSGGHIELDSEVGAGTTFRITLPQASEAPENAPANDSDAGDADTADRA